MYYRRSLFSRRLQSHPNVWYHRLGFAMHPRRLRRRLSEIFVGGLDSTIPDENLKQTYSHYGEITSVKMPLVKGCGVVQFANRNMLRKHGESWMGQPLANRLLVFLGVVIPQTSRWELIPAATSCTCSILWRTIVSCVRIWCTCSSGPKHVPCCCWRSVWGIFSISQPTSKLIAEVKMIKATFEWLHEMVKSWIWG